MKIIKYFFEYIFISILLFFFKIMGYENASNLGEKIGKFFGPYFRSKDKIINNLKQSNIGNSDSEREQIIKKMWGNYGRILSEYPYLKKFKKNNLNKYITVEGSDHLKEIKKNKKKVVFISGHFNNFELMAMQIENSGINVAAIYRPLNNFFLNNTMEKIRINDICKKQIKKGKAGTRELIKLFNEGYSVALMIDQRVSEGIPVKFFNKTALTTTIPAQLVKKYDCEVVPVYIERFNKNYFKINFEKPLIFKKDSSLDDITLQLNEKLELMILKNPDQWIWSLDRWK